MKKLNATEVYALVFGLFLGLCIWKFGNPVILDHKLSVPLTLSEWLNAPWPLHWANWLLLPFAAVGTVLAFKDKFRWPVSRRLWFLPLGWLGWQFAASTRTVDPDLTKVALWQFFGCVVCYFLGAVVLTRKKLLSWLLAGVLAAFALCLIRAVNQRVFEYPQSRQSLVEGERCGWTNYPPESLAVMKQDGIIVTTNGTDVVNPVIMAKFEKGRVSGTLVYPNALAGIILLLWPVSMVLAFGATKELRSAIRFAVIGLTFVLGGVALYWSGSKLGWLIGLVIAGVFLLRQNWSKKLKWTTVAICLVLGLSVFAVRFQHYFTSGAASAGARLDYWGAAVKITQANPFWGTGPGTFQRPYAQIKSPDSEMARLTHNDYLEQFSDSGIIGGVIYLAWIIAALLFAAKGIWNDDLMIFAIFVGVMAWFVQGMGEFSLYIPALAWTTFTLLGAMIARNANKFDK